MKTHEAVHAQNQHTDRYAMSSSRLDSLQCLRGLAAFGVVVHHATLSTSAFFADAPKSLYAIFSLGYLGVDFFFVLSGFIILNSHILDERTTSSFKKYAKKRLIRIFPPYWPISICLLLSYTLLPELSKSSRNDISLLSSLFLLPDYRAPALAVAWTLMHELLFYAIFSLYYFSTRLFTFAIFSWCTGIVACWILNCELKDSPLLQLIAAPINLEFILGIGIAYASRAINGAKLAWPFAVLGMVMIFSLLNLSSTPNRLVFSIPFSILLLSGIFFSRDRCQNFPTHLVQLGDASYSIYLIHSPLLALTTRLVLLFPVAAWWFGMVIGVTSSIIAGLIYHRFIEKPSIQMFNKLVMWR